MRARRFLLALVALVPLLLHGHFHGSAATVAHPCATCVVVHHAPASATAPLELHAAIELSTSTWTPATPRLAQASPLARSVRAPPLHDSLLSV